MALLELSWKIICKPITVAITLDKMCDEKRVALKRYQGNHDDPELKNAEKVAKNRLGREF